MTRLILVARVHGSSTAAALAATQLSAALAVPARAAWQFPGPTSVTASFSTFVLGTTPPCIPASSYQWHLPSTDTQTLQSGGASAAAAHSGRRGISTTSRVAAIRGTPAAPSTPLSQHSGAVVESSGAVLNSSGAVVESGGQLSDEAAAAAAAAAANARPQRIFHWLQRTFKRSSAWGTPARAGDVAASGGIRDGPVLERRGRAQKLTYSPLAASQQLQHFGGTQERNGHQAPQQAQHSTPPLPPPQSQPGASHQRGQLQQVGALSSSQGGVRGGTSCGDGGSSGRSSSGGNDSRPTFSGTRSGGEGFARSGTGLRLLRGSRQGGGSTRSGAPTMEEKPGSAGGTSGGQRTQGPQLLAKATLSTQGTVWKQIIDVARADKEKLRRMVPLLRAHCIETRQHPPVVAFNAMLDACNKAGDMDSTHAMVEVMEHTGLQPNDDTHTKLSEAFAYNRRIRT